MMRILMDEEGFGWDEAWNIVQSIFAYTNHTIIIPFADIFCIIF